ncbi:YutD family protein [Numidum massiliense]|uniref:YutD family protein n=1 Tax=Numidum massiliense TaxID=1522315 RepID=UPI0006D5B397|nr:YutD family protein [Numidum massiliense]
MIRIQSNAYELVIDYRNGWNQEAFKQRYSEILGKYDFIVGDWGYGQLRLKGFFADKNPKAKRDNRISQLEEYVHEYCNFGCAYFILRKVSDKKIKKTVHDL